MSESRLTQPAILANGSRVPLLAAAVNLGLLSDYLAEPDSDWDVVYYLREICLGRAVEPEQARALVREKLLAPDGSVDPALQAVVLSAVRGEGRMLHLESPFTDQTDRAIAEFVNAREYIRSCLDAAEAKAVLDEPVQRAIDHLRRPESWGDREARRGDSPEDPNLPSR